MLKVVSSIYYKSFKITFYIFFFYMGLDGINFEYIKPFVCEQVLLEKFFWKASVKVRKVKV